MSPETTGPPLPDVERATTVVPAPAAGPGNWSGAPSAVLADDGAFLHRVISPRHHVAKRYLATLDRPLDGHEAETFAAEERIDVAWERIWNIEPILFDEALIELADEAVTEVAGTSHRLPSGPLHDAAEVARAGVPTVMLFVQSLRGLSHTKLEDTRPEHLELAVRALDRLADKALAAAAV